MRFIRYDRFVFAYGRPDIFPYTFWFTATLNYKTRSGVEIDAGINRMMGGEK